jgi:gallate dioxygenase
MARIIGGVACSHTPTIGFAQDHDKQSDPVWAPIFEGFAPVREWLRDQQPDVAIVIYNDHVTSFFFDHYSAFALGVGGSWEPADEGGGPRHLPPIGGHPRFAAHVGASLVADEFDLAFFQDRPLDHGCFSPLSVLCGHDAGWPFPIVPLQVGVLQAPSPGARRCWRLGQALRRAVESYDEDLRVAVIATGGLSHQVHGERAGFNHTAWDERFLDLIERDPVRLTEMTLAELAALGGYESAEVVMWLVMRGALPASVVRRHRSYTLPSMTAIATLVLEGHGEAPSAETLARHREHIARELRGVERLEGTYPFTLERSVKSYQLNKFLHALVEPAARERFRADEDAAMRAAGLTDVERDLVARRDWRALMHHGAIFFVLEKLAAVVGVSNLHVYAAMRGQSLDDFQRTRKAAMSYSVAGVDAPKARRGHERPVLPPKPSA